MNDELPYCVTENGTARVVHGCFTAPKSHPAPNIPGNTEAERMGHAVRAILTVLKDDLLKAEAKWKADRARKKKKPNKTP